MPTLVLEGHLCMAGDGYECSYLVLDGEFIGRLLKPYGTKILNVKVKRLPGAKEDARYWADHLQRDYGQVHIAIEFLREPQITGQEQP